MKDEVRNEAYALRSSMVKRSAKHEAEQVLHEIMLCTAKQYNGAQDEVRSGTSVE